MNSNILIYCDSLTNEDVHLYTKIPFVDEDLYQGQLINSNNFKLLGVHFPFDIIENILKEYTNSMPTVDSQALKINVYINSPYAHSIILNENGPYIKQAYPLTMSLFLLGLCNGPLKMGPVTVWEVATQTFQIQIISVYSYEIDKLQIEL